jgi:uncharacterized protein (TIGR03663 family)
MALILAFAVLSRFLFLQNHQINHDESIYVLDSMKYLKEGYRFDPDQHGPFLFFLNMIIFSALGASDSTILLGPAALGVALVVLPLLLTQVRGVDGRGAIIASALFAASPSLMYFSRMMKNDIYVAAFLLGVVVFGVRYALGGKQRDQYIAAAFLGLLFATRVDAFVHSLIFMAFLAIYLLFGHRTRPIGPPAEHGSFRAWTIIASCMVTLLIYFFFYSIFPGQITGIRDNTLALIRFWWNRHQMYLLRGPATYYLGLMFEYELPVLVIFFLGLKRQLEADRWSRTVFRSTFLLFAILFICGSTPLPFFATYLHAGTLREVSFLVYWLFLATWGTLVLLRQGKILYAFLLFWAAASTVFYAYAGEKQPQIVLFSLLPLIVISGFFLSDLIDATDWGRLKPIYAAACAAAFAFYLYTAIVVCLVTYYYPSERLSNATTSPEVAQLRNLLVQEARETGLGRDIPVHFMFSFSSDTLAWYLRDFTNRRYSHRLDEFYPAVVFYNYKRYEYRPLMDKYYDHYKIHTNLGSGYHRRIQWWPPRELIDGLYREAQFQVFRWRFRPVGGAYIDVFVRRPRTVISPQDEASLHKLNEIFTRRTVPPLRQFGSRGSLPGELHGASDIELDARMHLYVADTFNSRVTKYSQDGAPLLSIKDDARPFAPHGLGLCDGIDSLYIAIPSANEVRQYGLNGQYLKSIVYAFIRPTDVACDGAGNVFVIDHSPGKVLKFDAGGHPAPDWKGAGSFLQSPASIKIDRRSGQILIVDIQQRMLVKLDRNGRHLASFAVPGLSEAQHKLYFDLDEVGRIFIPDLSNSRILVVDPGGDPVMTLGEESRAYGGILGPVSVALRQGSLHVYNQHLERIVVFDLRGLPLERRALWRRVS